MGEFGYLEVESGVVDQDYYVRIPFKYVFLAEIDIFKEFAGFCQDLYHSHDSAFLVMTD